MDKLGSIQAFTQVVSAGGFAAAARKMGLSRSMVNKLVKALENDLGVQLLHRSTRVVKPTETGLAFYDRCVEILASLEEAQRSIAQLQQEPKGTLRINAPMTFGTMDLSPAIADFLSEYPALKIQLTLNDRLIDPIEEGFDITIRISKPRKIASLISIPIKPIRLLLCASPTYLQNHGIPSNINELQKHSCLHYGHIATENQWQLTTKEKTINLPISGVLCSNNGEVLKDAAIKGLGIALLPEFIIKREISQNQLQQVLSDYYSEELFLNIIYPVNRHLSAKVRLMIDFLKERFTD